MRSPPLRRKTTCEKHDLVQSGKSSLTKREANILGIPSFTCHKNWLTISGLPLIQSLRMKRKISFIEARKVVRATYAPSTTRSYAAAVSVKKTVGCQTPQWPEQAVKPQSKQKAPNHQSEKPKPQGKKASTTSSDRGTQSIDVGTDDEGKNTQPSIGRLPSGSSPGQSGSPSRIPLLTRGNLDQKHQVEEEPKSHQRHLVEVPNPSHRRGVKRITSHRKKDHLNLWLSQAMP